MTSSDATAISKCNRQVIQYSLGLHTLHTNQFTTKYNLQQLKYDSWKHVTLTHLIGNPSCSSLPPLPPSLSALRASPAGMDWVAVASIWTHLQEGHQGKTQYEPYNIVKELKKHTKSFTGKVSPIWDSSDISDGFGQEYAVKGWAKRDTNTCWTHFWTFWKV